MPDLSLFSMICHELDITVNELMSGERISEGSMSKLKKMSDEKFLKQVKKLNRMCSLY